jgi:hypothetical protein
MDLNRFQDETYSDFCSVFPLKPIKDDRSYRAAIEFLDCLFALDDPRSPAEVEYFQTLANFACDYEMKTNVLGPSAPTQRSLTRYASK